MWGLYMIISRDDYTTRLHTYDSSNNDVIGDLKMYKNFGEKFTTENLSRYHNRWLFRLVVDQVIDLRFVLIVIGTLESFSNNNRCRMYKDSNGALRTQSNFSERVLLTFDKTKKDFIKVNDGSVLHHINFIDFNPALDDKTKTRYSYLLETVNYAIYPNF